MLKVRLYFFFLGGGDNQYMQIEKKTLECEISSTIILGCI